MSFFDNPLVILAVVVAVVVLWWRFTRKAPWSGPGELSNLREEQHRYLEARDRIDREEDAVPPRSVAADTPTEPGASAHGERAG